MINESETLPANNIKEIAGSIENVSEELSKFRLPPWKCNTYLAILCVRTLFLLKLAADSNNNTITSVKIVLYINPFSTRVHFDRLLDEQMTNGCLTWRLWQSLSVRIAVYSIYCIYFTYVEQHNARGDTPVLDLSFFKLAG